MPPIRTSAEDLPLADRLVDSLRYPLRGHALAVTLLLAFAHWLVLPRYRPEGFTPPGLLPYPEALVIVWGAAWFYATRCLLHSAHGHDEPPAANLRGGNDNPTLVAVTHLACVGLLALVAWLTPEFLWPTLIAAILLLPALDLSLAFDGDPWTALYPVTWFRIVGRLGAAYLVPVGANAALALLVVWGLRAPLGHLPRVVVLPLFGFAAAYLILLGFRWMGGLVWHYREALDMTPQDAPGGGILVPDGDERLLADCETVAARDPEAAAIRLRDRIRERYAPAAVHGRFRQLLRQLGRDDLRISHGQDWIAQLCAIGDARRALGVVQECREIDPRFLPDDPANTAKLAKAAATIGMPELAWYLANGFVQRWPGHADAAALKLLAAARGKQP